MAWIEISLIRIQNYFWHIGLFKQAFEVAKIDGNEIAKEKLLGIIWEFLLWIQYQ